MRYLCPGNTEGLSLRTLPFPLTDSTCRGGWGPSGLCWDPRPPQCHPATLSQRRTTQLGELQFQQPRELNLHVLLEEQPPRQNVAVTSGRALPPQFPCIMDQHGAVELEVLRHVAEAAFGPCVRPPRLNATVHDKTGVSASRAPPPHQQPRALTLPLQQELVRLLLGWWRPRMRQLPPSAPARGERHHRGERLQLRLDLSSQLSAQRRCKVVELLRLRLQNSAGRAQ